MANRAVLHLICGQAGSGKTTYAKQLETHLNAFRFTKDEWMVSLYGRHIIGWSPFNGQSVRKDLNSHNLC